MKKILVIRAHPRKNSFCNALADAYINGAKESGHEIKILDLRELNLEEFIKDEHIESPQLPEDLLETQELITWSDHLVFVYPTWWASPPALLKLFFEIIFISSFAFKHKQSIGNIHKWDKLLKNKSARIISTMDSPSWYYKWIVGDPGFKMMRNILNYCGIQPVHKNYFGYVRASSQEQRKKYLEKIYLIGLNE